MQEGDYKGSIDTVLLFGFVYIIFCGALVSRQFDRLQTESQLLVSGVMLSFVVIGFLYFRFATSSESQKYLLWRYVSYLLMLSSSLLFVFQSIYESANNSLLFYIVLVFLGASYFVSLSLRLMNDDLNINAAIKDGRFSLSGIMNFSIDYRPLKTSIPWGGSWNRMAQTPYDNKKYSTWIAIVGILCVPFIHTVVGAYLIGFIMIFMSLVATRLLIHATLDLLFYNQITRL
ncbi:hypothetical protein [Vibrio mangrovi]|uniref:Uncharacterized protein n=1 Tax=Vibrio mangrovi TaxID=474394 RepID=A0A1Y6IV29_9VIBR|nr:hypothetical protein [Vibrio mangrovi]MDW6002143.1 hypothetical protein [Vibrio mangrovi]SMS01488.1 hypothetical protein VIM7927_02784 [Vibrio mangrovi]